MSNDILSSTSCSDTFGGDGTVTFAGNGAGATIKLAELFGTPTLTASDVEVA